MSTSLLKNSSSTTEDWQRPLIDAASKAPSPDNNQPWAFRCIQGGIEVFHQRIKALPSDVKDMFSWIGLGAAIENLVLKASSIGMDSSVDYEVRPFDVQTGAEHIATLRFRDGGQPDPLSEWIDRRVTNRKLYRRQSIPKSTLRTLAETRVSDDHRVCWLTERSELKQLARLVRVADRIRFEHRPFHVEFHNVLRYGETHARSCGDGLDLRTLEVPWFAGPVFRWLRPWKRMRFANRFGISRIFAGYSAKQVLRSGAVGLLTTSDRSDRGYLEAGRLFQRLWLAATRAGLAFQPLGGLPLFLTKLDVQGPAAFHSRHARQLQAVAGPFWELFPEAKGSTPVMMFRIGHAAQPSARSLRYPTNQIVIPNHRSK